MMADQPEFREREGRVIEGIKSLKFGMNTKLPLNGDLLTLSWNSLLQSLWPNFCIYRHEVCPFLKKLISEY